MWSVTDLYVFFVRKIFKLIPLTEKISTIQRPKWMEHFEVINWKQFEMQKYGENTVTTKDGDNIRKICQWSKKPEINT